MKTTLYRTSGVLFLASVLVLAGIQTAYAQDSTAQSSHDDMAMNDAPNTLTEEEKADGWELLFDGEDFSHWRGFKQDSVPAGWTIDDNAIHFTGEQQAGDLITDDEYESFELQLDWKIAEGGNSGIMFHVTEDNDRTYQSGPEMQVLDDAGHPDAQNGPDRLAGANYALHPPSNTEAVNPAGEWNTVRLVVDGQHVEHWMNGEKVVEYELGSDEWKELVATSKFGEMPNYGIAGAGHIALQDHGDPVWYRNIKIRQR